MLFRKITSSSDCVYGSEKRRSKNRSDQFFEWVCFRTFIDAWVYISRSSRPEKTQHIEIVRSSPSFFHNDSTARRLSRKIIENFDSSFCSKRDIRRESSPASFR